MKNNSTSTTRPNYLLYPPCSTITITGFEPASSAPFETTYNESPCMNSSDRSSLFFLGRPLTPLYGSAMKVRALLYRSRILRSYQFDVPVISVGNLTMGGTGKTPMVIYLARFLADRGFKPAVISRGYRGQARGPVNIVSDGTSILLPPQEAGDEPVLISSRLKGTVVATGRKRHLVSEAVIRSHQCNLIIMDDGFQHLKMKRDIDLVLFDADHFAGSSRVFPGGELREPVSSLQRCDAFILTGVTEHNLERADKCADLLQERFSGKPVFKVTPMYAEFYRYTISPDSISREIIPPPEIPHNLYGFSGIANSERFYRMAGQQGIRLSGRKSFRDHHDYSAADMNDLSRQAEQAGADGFLTTEKDMVKLTAAHHAPLPFYVPVLDYAANAALDSFILDNLKEISST
jgi:tetraacyldisaccharide 4'-kinase